MLNNQLMQRCPHQVGALGLAGAPGEDLARAHVLPHPDGRAAFLAGGQRHQDVVAAAVAVDDVQRLEPGDSAGLVGDQVHGRERALARADDLGPREVAPGAPEKGPARRQRPAPLRRDLAEALVYHRRAGRLFAQIVAAPVPPELAGAGEAPAGAWAPGPGPVEQGGKFLSACSALYPPAPTPDGFGRDTDLLGRKHVRIATRETFGVEGNGTPHRLKTHRRLGPLSIGAALANAGTRVGSVVAGVDPAPLQRR